MKSDIQTIEDVQLMVDTFYTRIREDDKLGDIFNNVIQDRWLQHLETMYKFWQSILLGENTYSGQPFLKHINLPISEEHFARWLYLFHTTVNELFEGPVADEAKKRGAMIAAMFNSKLKVIHGQA
jgi:hemoglobin